SLHGEPAFVGWLPFGEERAVAKSQTGGLLDDIDVDCRSGEHRGDDQRELPCKHDHVSRRNGSIRCGHSLTMRSAAVPTHVGKAGVTGKGRNAKTVTISHASLSVTW